MLGASSVAYADLPVGSSTDTTSQPITARWGKIGAFEGDVQGSWGKIGAFGGGLEGFWGKIGAFEGNVEGFWGKIGAFGGDIESYWGRIGAFEGGDITAHWGRIGAFWGKIGAFWGDIDAQWGKIGAFDIEQYTSLSLRLKDMVSESALFWGAAVEASTGKSFEEGFANLLLAKHGIDLNDPASLAKLSPEQRARFMMEWYDGLMGFSGFDHVDHWMKTVNWTPAVTQQQGTGKRAVIGLLDFFVAGDTDIAGKIISYDGVSDFSNGHGAGVASLMVSAHDGKGVMGIAPNASVVAYNPFDATGTANWDDVRKGVAAISASGASVINMSLGVSGWTLHPDWKTVFADTTVSSVNQNTVFVIAAGNDGIKQTTNVAWDWATDPNMIIVGSVGPDETISSFSNTPGTACLLKKATDNKCDPKNQLMTRFMVAPGELILVSDDKGGVTRASGTSFAAPLVAGTIALLHDRWPWLKQYPAETVQIILRSAKDLGAKGVDPIYGWGLLDVTAAQSVLDFDRLKFYEVTDGVITQRSAKTVQQQGVKSSWEAAGAYFSVFDNVGKTQRDFVIPLSSRLVNQSVMTVSGPQQFQEFLYARLVDWINAGAKGPAGPAGFTSLGYSTSSSDNPYGMNITFTMVAKPPSEYSRDIDTNYAMRFSNDDGSFGVTAGYGLGAAAMGFMPGFDMASDYDVTSGVNPFLALASGGVFASFDFALSDDLRISTGLTSQDLDLKIETEALGHERRVFEGLPAYQSTAFNATLTYTPSDAITLTAGYTRLEEDTGLLGVQWVDGGLDMGAVTHVASFGAAFDVGYDIDLAVSASFATTNVGGGNTNLSLIDDAKSSAFELAVNRRKLFSDSDLVRLSVSQPMNTDDGRMEYTSVEVIDRETGEIGVVTRSFGLESTPDYIGEIAYGTALMDGNGELSIFAKSEFRTQTFEADEPELSAGAAFRLRF